MEGMDLAGFTDHAVKAIADAHFDPIYSTSPLAAQLQLEKIEDELAEQMLEGKFKAGSRVTCEISRGKICFYHAEEPKKSAQPSEPTNPAE